VRNSWSPIREAVFITSLAPLVVTELMYNPLPPPDGVPYSSTDFEFAELQNVGLETIDLSGVSLTRAVTFSFADGQVPQIAPGEFVVVAKNVEALATRYDLTGVKVAGAYTGDLSDRGETFTIAGAVNETILGFSYQDAWYPETDGLGRSLVVLDPRAARETWGASESWRPSAAIGGSPGREDSAPPPESLQRPGDLSQDGKVDIIDIIGLLSYLFEGVVAELPCAGGTLIGEGNVQLLDFDGSGQVNVTDAVNVMNYLFHNGSRHVLGVDCIPIAGCPSSCTP
jgi:hypothetical protein